MKKIKNWDRLSPNLAKPQNVSGHCNELHNKHFVCKFRHDLFRNLK